MCAESIHGIWKLAMKTPKSDKKAIKKKNKQGARCCTGKIDNVIIDPADTADQFGFIAFTVD